MPGRFWYLKLIKHRFPLSRSASQDSESPGVLASIADSLVFLVSRSEMGPEIYPKQPRDSRQVILRTRDTGIKA